MNGPRIPLERAHPDAPGFRMPFSFVLRRGIIPWIRYKPSPGRSALKWRYAYVRRYARNKDVLDVPCGMGWGTSLITRARSVVAIDKCEEAIREAQKRYPSAARFMVGDMQELSVASSSFDVVSCLEGIEHVTESVAIAFLREVRRVLRDSGTLILSSPFVPGGTHSGNPHHLREYQPHELRALIADHFTIEEESFRAYGSVTILLVRAVTRRRGISNE